MALFVCMVCGLDIERDAPGISRKVKGWQKNGSTSVHYAEELYEYAHTACLSMRRVGQSETLF